jgi:hypothetical protein
MPAWVRLAKEKSRSFYRVPGALVEKDCNVFYGMEHPPRDTDGPWPLLAFLQERDQRRVVTFQFYTIEAEELAAQSFNPLAQPSGSLSLDRAALTELATLLSCEAAKLTDRQGDRRMFQQIGAAKLADFRLHVDQFPGSKGQYYCQIYDPLEPAQGSQTILIFSSGQASRPSARLYFKVAQFPRRALEQPAFDVLDDSLARINLDGGGMAELAGLLREQLRHL